MGKDGDSPHRLAAFIFQLDMFVRSVLMCHTDLAGTFATFAWLFSEVVLRILHLCKEIILEKIHQEIYNIAKTIISNMSLRI